MRLPLLISLLFCAALAGCSSAAHLPQNAQFALYCDGLRPDTPVSRPTPGTYHVCRGHSRDVIYTMRSEDGTFDMEAVREREFTVYFVPDGPPAR